MKKLLALLASGLLISLLSVPSLNGTVAIGQENFGPPTDLQFNLEGDEFNVEVQREEGQQADAAAAAAAGAIGLVGFLIWLALIVVIVAAGWVVFTKAGKPGWAAIVPIYNLIVLMEICGRPLWWFVLLLIPCVQIVIGAIVSIDLAKSFGKDVVFGILIWLLPVIFVPILAFGSAQYQGPAAAESK
jgi:hypothetical protein